MWIYVTRICLILQANLKFNEWNESHLHIVTLRNSMWIYVTRICSTLQANVKYNELNGSHLLNVTLLNSMWIYVTCICPTLHAELKFNEWNESYLLNVFESFFLTKVTYLMTLVFIVEFLIRSALYSHLYCIGS